MPSRRPPAITARHIEWEVVRVLGLLLFLILQSPDGDDLNPAKTSERLTELIASSKALLESGDPIRSRLLAAEAQQLARELDQQDKWIEALVIQGDALQQFKEDQSAELVFRRAIAKAAELGFWKLESEGLARLSHLHYARGQYQQAMAVEQEVFQRANDHSDQHQMAQSLNDIGVLYKKLGQYSEAMDYYFRALELREMIEDQKGVSQSLNNIGIVHKNLGNYIDALDYQLRSIEIRQKIDDQSGLAQSYGNVGIIYKHLGDYERAIKYHLQALDMWRARNEQSGVGRALNNLGTTYAEWGKGDQALTYLYESLSVVEALGDMAGIANAKAQIGSIFLEQDKVDEAESLLRDALSLNREIGGAAEMVSNMMALGQVMRIKDDLQGSKKMIEDALALSEELGTKPLIRDSLVALASLEGDIGNYERGMKMMSRAFDLNEEFVNSAVTQKIADLQTQYAIDAKQREIELLRRENELNNLELNRQKTLRRGGYALLGFMILSGILLFTRYRESKNTNRKLQQLNDQIQVQSDDLKEMNEHLQQRTHELAGKNEELYVASITDPLTKVYNRSYLMTFLEREIAKVRRHVFDLSLLMIDVDHFKRINDRFGHLCGDRVLAAVAARMKRIVRVEDVITRYGGEEFAVVLTNTRRDQAYRVAEKIRIAIEEMRFPEFEEAGVTVSIGVLDQTTCNPLTIDRLIACADDALYRAKEAGRNQCVLYGEVAS